MPEVRWNGKGRESKVVGQFGFPQERNRMLALKPRPSIKSKRLNRKGRMTFVVGLYCHAGIVLCSDSLESDGYDKRNVKKLYHYDSEHWGVAWGCAGDSDVIHRFTEKLWMMLEKEPGDCDWLRLQSLIEAVGKEIHENYTEAQLQIVIGVWQLDPMMLKLCRMDVLRGNCLSVEEDYACAGMDLSLGKFVLNNLHHPSLTIGEGLNLAIFVTHLMKNTADGVGRPIQLLTYRLTQPEWKEYEPSYLEEQERRYATEDVANLIREYWGKKNPSWLPPLTP
jgi:20S proteasome alpha/beta subunit